MRCDLTGVLLLSNVVFEAGALSRRTGDVEEWLDDGVDGLVGDELEVFGDELHAVDLFFDAQLGVDHPFSFLGLGVDLGLGEVL